MEFNLLTYCWVRALNYETSNIKKSHIVVFAGIVIFNDNIYSVIPPAIPTLLFYLPW